LIYENLRPWPFSCCAIASTAVALTTAATVQSQSLDLTASHRMVVASKIYAAIHQGRIYLLVDRFCGSACEDFVMPFKDTRRGVIGETTAGAPGMVKGPTLNMA
jgi:C-terminal processing protease CtpA/Prc